MIDAPPPKTKKELQRFLGKINFLIRFISNSAGKIQPFTPLLKLQGEKEFVWEAQHQEATESRREPTSSAPLKLYISASELSIGSLLCQDNEKRVEHAVFYLSRTLTDCETSLLFFLP